MHVGYFLHVVLQHCACILLLLLLYYITQITYSGEKK